MLLLKLAQAGRAIFAVNVQDEKARQCTSSDCYARIWPLSPPGADRLQVDAGVLDAVRGTGVLSGVGAVKFAARALAVRGAVDREHMPSVVPGVKKCRLTSAGGPWYTRCKHNIYLLSDRLARRSVFFGKR